jgi:RimJ/RimL family protein N-acetyltransferase
MTASDPAVAIRPIEPADASALVRFHDRLSTESVRRRFFTAHPHLTPAEVERFTSVDHHRREAFVATAGDELVGVGRFERLGESTDAEVAFVVADEWQDHGLATALLHCLEVSAAQQGITRLVAETLADNAPMLAVFAHSGHEIENAFDHGVVHVVLRVDRADQEAEPVGTEGTIQVNTEPPSSPPRSSE